jgi:two-component system chemotaxis response regulator CheB
MPAGFTRGFAERIDRLTPFSAREAQDGDEPVSGLVLVAPGGRHLEFERSGARTLVRLGEAAAGDKYAPSVDRLFVSAAKHYAGQDLLAIVLTGMGDDGRFGVTAIQQAGGRVVAESEETAVVFGMPQQAIRTGAVDAVLPLQRIAGAIDAGVDGGVRERTRRETA